MSADECSLVLLRNLDEVTNLSKSTNTCVQSKALIFRKRF